ncbi:MAG: ABC transporter ATP-binding protein/permease [Bacilli bacterium]|nr:ABC transporter ATP-binding protein/permease [Bacilli bacterium]
MQGINVKSGVPVCALPESIQHVLFPDFQYNGVTISTKDQVVFLDIASQLSGIDDMDVLFHKMDEFPENIYELVRPVIDFEQVKKIVLIVAFLYGLNSIFGFIEGLIMVSVTNNYSRGVRNSISKKINKLPLKYFDTHTIGDVLSRVTNDVDTISQSMNQSFTTLVSASALFIGSLIMMFYTNWIMAITAVVSSLFGFVFMFMILSKSQKYFTARQVELGNINGHIEEVFSGHNVVKLYNGKKEVDKTFDELNEKVFESERKSQFLSGLMHPFMHFIGNFGYVCVCIVGALLTLNGSISFGVIVAFMLYIRLFTNPLTQLAQSMTSLQSVAAASERVFEFLEQEEMEDETHKKKRLHCKDVTGEIEFDHVKFGYNDDKIVIKDFNAHVKPGQKIAIVGPTGAGKTTLVNLLMRFYELNSGDIRIDGVSIKELTRDNIHKLFIMVLQDTWLFNGTIRDNIRYNKKNVTDEQIKEVCRVVGIEHYIKTLPNGLDSDITDANSISSGQKQLLTIARGMIEDAPFLILDEATSNVDTRTEELVQKAMDKLTEGRTSFIIAHRLSTIKNADLILVMNDGNIIEQGNHDELMKQNGFYAGLYNSQFEKFSE